jgi:PTS system mannose-specific IID component
MLARLFVVQGAWSYEGMLGVGLAWALEPALRLLPGGPGGDAYRGAIARHATYFNCHPYFAALAVGALARAELSGVPPAKIARFRAALCGPLGSVGDRLVWAAWLPVCALGALVLWGLGVPATGAVALFLVSYNVGHVGLRAWGLRAGWRRGLEVAGALATPVIRDGPAQLGRVASALVGVALPLIAARVIPGDRVLAGAALAFAIAAGYLVARLHGRVQGWLVALVVLVLQVLASVLP